MTELSLQLDHADAVALLARQTEILEQVAVGSPLVDVLTGIARTLEDLVPGCCCSVLLLDRETGTLRHVAAPSLPAEYSAGIDGMTIGAGAGSCGTAAYTGRPAIAVDIRADARWASYRGLADRFGLRACWSTPIRGLEGVSGTFAVYHASPHRPTPREEHLVERLTHLASVAIDHEVLVGALSESEERFRRAFEDNAVGMALATLDGEVTRVNRAMRALLGRSEADLVGTRLDAMFPPRRGGVDERADGYSEEYEASARAADGRLLDLSVSLSPILGTGGAPRALSVNVLDVTGRRAAERERRKRVEAELARHAAETASRAKTDFVSALGHELRTPLQAITGFTELLGTLDLVAERRTAALEHITAAAGHILSMVDEVLDIARIEARALPLTLTAVAVDPVVADVLAMVEPLAAAERVTLYTEPWGVPVHVRADGRRTTQVLLNLVTNAIRYNRPDGRVVVGWAVEGGRATITVRDTGPGIAAEDLGRLFTPFDRLGSNSDEGIGLGLPLARGLTQAMGGTLEVRSDVDAGTTVTVVLPIAEPRDS